MTDYAPWAGAWHKKDYKSPIHVSDLEKACPRIILCTTRFALDHPSWNESFREYFHRDIGCIRYWKECKGENGQGPPARHVGK